MNFFLFNLSLLFLTIISIIFFLNKNLLRLFLTVELVWAIFSVIIILHTIVLNCISFIFVASIVFVLSTIELVLCLSIYLYFFKN